jgi:hypothetical protein
MTVPFSKPSYTGARVGGRDSAHASDTSVELQLLHDKKIVEEDSHNTKDTHSKCRPTKVPSKVQRRYFPSFFSQAQQ